MKLLSNSHAVEQLRLVLIIRLETANVVRSCCLNLLHQFAELASEGSADRSRSLLRGPRGSKYDLDERVAGPGEQLHRLPWELVTVLFNECERRIRNGPGVVVDGELRSDALRSGCAVLRVRVPQRSVHAVRQLLPRPLRNETLIIQSGEDALGLVLDQVKAVLVIRVCDEAPGDALGDILLLLEMEDVVVELLLQRFILQ